MVDVHAVAHLVALFDPEKFEVILQKALVALKAHSDEFDAIAFSGLSGSLIVPILCRELNKYMIAVRKEPTPHSSYKVEGVRGKQYIILDDMMASGTTVRRIKESIAKELPESALVAGYFYRNNGCTVGFGKPIWSKH